jgi:putative heme-binding domain-containing protein
MRRFDQDAFPKSDLTLDHAKTAVGLNDPQVTALVEKQFGKLAPATAGEKQARIAWLSRELQVGGRGDPTKGKVLFTKHCGACHQLHGEGGKVGPDLTTADRKNRTYMLTQIVDPSGYIRPEYVVHNVSTTDGRKLSGIVTESSAESVTLVNVVNDQPQKTVVAKADVEDMKPSAVSLMPEKLLDTLSYPEIVDLFAYLASDAPAGRAPGVPDVKKLKVCLVSGSFEYKSDDSLAVFQKYLEANFPVECTLVSAKTEKDQDLPGLEHLEKCDAAIFFTRRLQLHGAALDKVRAFVKSGKPIVGIRTASHGFQNWLAMDKEVFGGDYKNHFGQKIECEVTVEPKAKDHPVLRGVGGFKTTGGLYKNPAVASDVTVLLRGTIPQASEPVAWVREKDGRRVFYTSLGTPDDFKDPNFTRLLINGLAWVTKSEWKPAK